MICLKTSVKITAKAGKQVGWRAHECRGASDLQWQEVWHWGAVSQPPNKHVFEHAMLNLEKWWFLCRSLQCCEIMHWQLCPNLWVHPLILPPLAPLTSIDSIPRKKKIPSNLQSRLPMLWSDVGTPAKLDLLSYARLCGSQLGLNTNKLVYSQTSIHEVRRRNKRQRAVKLLWVNHGPMKIGKHGGIRRCASLPTKNMSTDASTGLLFISYPFPTWVCLLLMAGLLHARLTCMATLRTWSGIDNFGAQRQHLGPCSMPCFGWYTVVKIHSSMCTLCVTVRGIRSWQRPCGSKYAFFDFNQTLLNTLVWPLCD